MAASLFSNYDELIEKAKNICVLESTVKIFTWDTWTMMPPSGVEQRSLQLALLERMVHKMSTDPEIGRLLEKIVRHPTYDSLDTVQKRNVYLIKKDYDEQTKLPEELVSETSKQKTIAVDVWKKAKAVKDFSMFRPELEKLFDLKRQAAEILMEVKETATPYDALLDIWAPKMTTKTLNRILPELREGLVSIMRKCEASPRQPDVSILRRRVPVDVQREVARSIAEFAGYDIQSKKAWGRIDETEHPFAEGYLDDVRVATHYYEDDFQKSIIGTLHEVGHALYMHNLNREWMFQPVGQHCSNGFHESQSKFLETIVGKSREFWTYFLPKLKKLVGSTISHLDLDSFVYAVNQVKPGKLRLYADEVTYSLHIMIRLNLEFDLFADKITVAELPQVWNQSYKEYLGVDIENDSEGVMQDLHWALGGFGAFTAYSLGLIYSGQLLATMEKDLPDWKTQISGGDFQNVKQWLIKNVYSYANLYDPLDLIKVITGEGLNVKLHLDYLNRRYSKLYGF